MRSSRKSSTPHFYLENEKISKEEHQAEAQQQSAKRALAPQCAAKTEKSETALYFVDSLQRKFSSHASPFSFLRG